MMADEEELNEEDWLNLPELHFYIRGGTHDGRQRYIRQLEPGTPVRLVHEPDNPYDEYAVQVQLLDGTMLGYVPADMNQEPLFGAFEDTALAEVISTGRANRTSWYGAMVRYHPLRPPIAVKTEQQLETQPAEHTALLDDQVVLLSDSNDALPEVSEEGVLRFRIRGVSFDGRQEHVKRLVPGTPVLVAREMGTRAMRVQLLDGTQLGYVPSKLNRPDLMLRRVSVATIVSAGPSIDAPHLYGATVLYDPHRVPLLAEAIPEELQPQCADPFSVAGLLDDVTCQELLSEILQARLGRCAVSGVTGQTLRVAPIWWVDDVRMEVLLVGFQAITELLAHAQRALLQPGQVEAETLQAFCRANDWSLAALETYRARQMQLLAERRGKEWHLVFEMPRARGNWLES